MSSDSKKKMLILGATGMAGHIVYQYFLEKKEHQMFNACFRNKLTEDSFILNVRDENSIKDVLEKVKPDIVINCIGILIKGANAFPENAIFVNAYFPHLLSRLLHEVCPNSKLVHISTDCVFSGKKGMYKDTDEKDALDVYGMSKNLGEVINERDLTIRTSIIGPELKRNGEGLFHWIFSQKTVGKLNGYTKSIWGGVTTLELAGIIDFCISQNLAGLYQASNNRGICKADLVRLIVDEFKLPIEVSRVDGVVSDKSICNTVLDGNEYKVRPYKDMIKELHVFMKEHKALYKQYLGE